MALALHSASKFVAYLRVSTRRQGESGLGLDAQRTAVRQYIQRIGGSLLAEFQEIESGRRDENRPQLQEALDLCRLTGAALCVSRLDRLSRDASFLLRLAREASEEQGLQFVCADMPEATELTIGMLALVAEHEAKLIRTRIREALAEVRKQERAGTRPPGKHRMGPRPIALAALLEHGPRGRQLAAIKIVRGADTYAKRLAPLLRDLRAHGVRTLASLADELTRREIRTRRGGRWTPNQVARILDRLGIERPTHRFARRGTKQSRRQGRRRSVPSVILRERRPTPVRPRRPRS